MTTKEEKPNLTWISRYRTNQPNFGLERMEKILSLRGNPHLQLSVIHIAGTNGKGSTIATLLQLLKQKGLRVGTFISPYILSYNEQIAIDGQPISSSDLNQLLQDYQELFAQHAGDETLQGVTEFELITALAYDYFAQQKVDVAIIEVGMGGRLDSTNVCQSDLTAITTIGLDHVALLGQTLGAIAEQKAGIIKSQTPLVTGKIAAEALAVIEKEAIEKSAPLFLYGKDYQIKLADSQRKGEVFAFSNANRTEERYETRLLGSHQAENAALAIELCDQYCRLKGIPLLDSKELAQALSQVVWPARLEVISERPLILLDGAHNPHALRAMLPSFEQRYQGQKKQILFTCIQTKALEEMLALLKSQGNSSLTLTSFADERSLSQETMQELAQKEDLTYEQWQRFVDTYLEDSHENEVLLVTGSLYFIAQVRAYLLEKKEENDGPATN